jgi:hypothetical protein
MEAEASDEWSRPTRQEGTPALDEAWPSLPLAAWKPTRDTLHRWTQIVGKVRLALAPDVNHWWHVTFHLTSRGLTTPPIPFGRRTFAVDFDFWSHELQVATSEGRREILPLRSRSVAGFYRAFRATLRHLDIEADVWPVPVEVADALPFDEDEQHRAYDPEAARRFWRVLAGAHRVLERFRAGFLGKSSPAHFFWGGFDLACTRFSGRRAPDHAPIPGVPLHIVREAYSHEVSSCGFWPGDERYPAPAFYAYAYPEPPGYRQAAVEPEDAFYSEELGEFLLPYERVRTAPDPEDEIDRFLHSTYRAAATLARWDRRALERDAPPRPGP